MERLLTPNSTAALFDRSDPLGGPSLDPCRETPNMNHRLRHHALTLAASAVSALCFTATSANAQVIIDDTLPVTIGVGNQGTTGLAIVTSYDASASDKLVVVVSTEHAFGITVGMSINSIEYNGNPMIEAVQENTLPGTSAIFYLDNPGPAGEIRIFQGNQNGGRATVYALSNVAPGVESIGQSTTDTVDVTTTSPNALVIAGILDGGQASNGNGASAPTALAPLVQTHNATWGNSWAGFCSGHQIAAAPGVTTSSFSTGGLVRLRTVAVAFADGCATCTNGSTASVVNLGGGTNGTMTSTSTGNLGCKLNWSVTGATPSSLGVFAASLSVSPIPLGALLPGCSGTLHVVNPAFAAIPTDATGAATLDLPVPTNQALCGATVAGQYAAFQTGACIVALTDAIAITIGN